MVGFAWGHGKIGGRAAVVQTSYCVISVAVGDIAAHAICRSPSRYVRSSHGGNGHATYPSSQTIGDLPRNDAIGGYYVDGKVVGRAPYRIVCIVTSPDHRAQEAGSSGKGWHIVGLIDRGFTGY